MNIIIAGDFFVADEYKGQTLIDGSIIDIFKAADYGIVNLEAPITADKPRNRILKTGPHLRCSSDTTLPYLKQLKLNTVTLANNHILDYGPLGLSDTINTLKNNQIEYVGAGNTIQEAQKILTIRKDNLGIALLNFAENEWSIAEDEKPGANPLDIINNVKQIKAAKANHDRVICIIHGGYENYQLPSPRIVKLYHFYAENGADAIIGHHTHCIGPYEIYNNVPIFYSLGNFVYNRKGYNYFEINNYGYLVKLNVSKINISFEIIPFKHCDRKPGVYFLSEEEKHIFINKLERLNEIVKNESLLNNEWKILLGNRMKSYLIKFECFNFWIYNILRHKNLIPGFLSKKRRMFMLNLIRCESHHNLTIESLSATLNTKNDSNSRKRK